jgi:hypothetical protein
MSGRPVFFPFPFPILLRGECKRRWSIMSLQSERQHKSLPGDAFEARSIRERERERVRVRVRNTPERQSLVWSTDVGRGFMKQ